MSIKHCLLSPLFSVCLPTVQWQLAISAPEPQTGTIIGTVTDVNDGTVPGATV